MELNYFKQARLYNPEAENAQPEIHIYGAGSIGSHTAISLMKTGFRKIIIHDFDTIEPGNLPAQFYSIDTNEKSLKTEEIRKMCFFMTGATPDIKNQKIEENTQLTTNNDSIHILALDNIKTRREIVNKLKNKSVWIIDGRIGGWQHEVYTFQANEESSIKRYLENLDGEFKEMECGEKCLWAVNSAIASIITSRVINILNPLSTHVPTTEINRLDSPVRIIGDGF